MAFYDASVHAEPWKDESKPLVVGQWIVERSWAVGIDYVVFSGHGMVRMCLQTNRVSLS